MTFEQAIEELKKKYPVVIITGYQIAEAMEEMDAVSVVRCKNCKHCRGFFCDYTTVCLNPNDFCSKGEEKEEEE